MSRRTAVVGGGIFGVTCAVALAEAGHRVTLFEAADDLLCAASGINQYRLHRGYHYPRSLETAVASRDAEIAFRAVYAGAVVDAAEHYYAIARQGSLTDVGAFVEFLRELGLEHRPVSLPFLDPETIEGAVSVRESLFDPAALRALAWERLRGHGVETRLGRAVTLAELDPCDLVVVATYAALNAVLAAVGGDIDYQYEVVEKPVIRPPASLAGRSLVVLDGPFTCIDPFGRTELSVIGNVVHAIHATNVGRCPDVPEPIRPLLDRGVVESPPVTKFPLFVETAAEFVRDARTMEHVGSMFTIRTVLPGLDETDARPTLVQRVGERVITVFSGKIGTCVAAAEEVVALAESD